MVRLTRAQRATLGDLCDTTLKSMALLGVDPKTDDPVVWVKDQYRSFPMVIRHKGNGEMAFSVRQLTEQEILELNERDANLLLSIPIIDFIDNPQVLLEEEVE